MLFWRGGNCKSPKIDGSGAVIEDKHDRQGMLISINQMESHQDGLLPVLKGKQNCRKYHVDTILFDHFSKLIYVHFSESTTEKYSVKAKHAFEKYAATFGVKIKKYHANSFALVPNIKTGYITPLFHIIFDDDFTITTTRITNKLPDNWDDIFKNHQQLPPEEFDFRIGKLCKTPTDLSKGDGKVNNNSPSDHSEGDRKVNNNSPTRIRVVVFPTASSDLIPMMG